MSTPARPLDPREGDPLTPKEYDPFWNPPPIDWTKHKPFTVADFPTLELTDKEWRDFERAITPQRRLTLLQGLLIGILIGAVGGVIVGWALHG